VHYGQFHIILGERVEQLLKEVAEVAKKHKSKEWRVLHRRMEDSERHRKAQVPFMLSESIEHISVAIYHLAQFEECPKGILDYAIPPETVAYFKEKLGRPIPKEVILRRLAYTRPRRGKLFGIFAPRIMSGINDVVAIDIEEAEDRDAILLATTSTKEEGLERLEKFIKSIPHLGDTVKEVRKRKTNSSRYAFRPYPLAVRLWLGHESAITVPKDLKDFLRGSIRYYSDEEWRTSIVLSAIAVESVLADLYEEQHKEYAPSVPLGDLYHKVKDKIDFPPYIKNAIEMVNEARISAVHRSRFPVSDREATNALYGSTTFTMWFSSNY